MTGDIYRQVNETDTFEFVESMKNHNSKTSFDLMNVHECLESVEENSRVEGISSKELDLYLARFFSEYSKEKWQKV